jgi:flavodoxin
MNKIVSVIISAGLLFTLSASYNKETYTPDAVSAATSSVRYTAEDLEYLQDHLLARRTDKDLTGKPYDLNDDGEWDVLDLCIMRSKVSENNTDDKHSDTIVVYFSRTGNTEKAAEHLINITGADSYVIEAKVPYTDDDIAYNVSTCRANQEQNDKTVRPAIADPITSIDSYDTIFIGYPIWWGQEPRIIDTFLESYDFSEKTVIPFCTSASSGISVSERNIAELVTIGKQLTGKRFSASASEDDIRSWYESLPLEK